MRNKWQITQLPTYVLTETLLHLKRAQFETVGWVRWCCALHEDKL